MHLLFAFMDNLLWTEFDDLGPGVRANEVLRHSNNTWSLPGSYQCDTADRASTRRSRRLGGSAIGEGDPPLRGEPQRIFLQRAHTHSGRVVSAVSVSAVMLSPVGGVGRMAKM